MSPRSSESAHDGPVSELLQNETVGDVVTEAIREYHRATVGLVASLDQLQRRSEEQREELWDAIYDLRHELADASGNIPAQMESELDDIRSRLDALAAGNAAANPSGRQDEAPSVRSKTSGVTGNRQRSSSGLRGTNDDPIDFGPLKLTGEFFEMPRFQLPAEDDASIYLLVDYYPPLALEIFFEGQEALVKGYIQAETNYSRAIGMVADKSLEFSIPEPDWGSQGASDHLYCLIRDSAGSITISGQDHQILEVLRKRKDS